MVAEHIEEEEGEGGEEWKKKGVIMAMMKACCFGALSCLWVKRVSLLFFGIEREREREREHVCLLVVGSG